MANIYTCTAATGDIAGLTTATSGKIKINYTVSGLTAGTVDGNAVDGTYQTKVAYDSDNIVLVGFTGVVTVNSIISEQFRTLTHEAEKLGSELVTNGDFENWTGDNPDDFQVLNEDINNYVTESGGQLRMVSDNSATIAIRPQPTTMLTVWNTYQVSVDLTFTSGTVNVVNTNFNTSGTKVFTFTASNTYAQIAKVTALYVLIDNMSIKEVTEENIYKINNVLQADVPLPDPDTFINLDGTAKIGYADTNVDEKRDFKVWTSVKDDTFQTALYDQWVIDNP